ncbi:hypothetical protein B0T24DRAFT_621144 [Lasiosphaeria ovina]|uniref:Secreted protein n=1 Tax=Lasiosphaeria ovina TaxID=92902 RepID=A0AAE0KJJ3_9PEZI|nr:hypothetical protein B0T24DRAFT_621144 [Lasiosphaeria ovina]
MLGCLLACFHACLLSSNTRSLPPAAACCLYIHTYASNGFVDQPACRGNAALPSSFALWEHANPVGSSLGRRGRI